MSQPPSLILTAKGSYSLVFSGTVPLGPGVGLTLIAGPITFPYRITGLEVVFRNDAANLLQIYPLVSRDRTISAGAAPADTNLIAPFVPTAFLIGEGLIKRVKLNYQPDVDQTYIKIHGLNGCAYAQTISATVEIEEA